MSNEQTDIDAPLSVAAAFDSIADRFDAELENDITRSIRERMYGTIADLLPLGASILDMNCGTGIDAIALSLRGYKVTGIDISSRMILRARQNASRAGLQHLRLLTGSFERLSNLVDSPYDLVLSNFGGLNCVEDLSSVSSEVARAVVPEGYFVAVVMPPFSLREGISYALRGKWKDAVRRLGSGAKATGFTDRAFTVHYHAPHSLVRVFRPWFEVRRTTGISVLGPTPQSTSFVRRHPRLAHRLENFDSLVGSLPVIRSMGDHYMIVLRRRPS